jgi:hypothetical protein
MQKVRDNCASTKGAEFDKLVQQKMKQEASGGGRRKHHHGLEENQITMVENELPDVDDSDDE